MKQSFQRATRLAARTLALSLTMDAHSATADSLTSPQFVTTPDGINIPLGALPDPLPLPAPDLQVQAKTQDMILRPWPEFFLLPPSVDLTPYQSPVKNQGGRDTCGTFASAAALEAAYLRDYGTLLDVSE